jgi:hypothetical protein
MVCWASVSTFDVLSYQATFGKEYWPPFMRHTGFCMQHTLRLWHASTAAHMTLGKPNFRINLKPHFLQGAQMMCAPLIKPHFFARRSNDVRPPQLQLTLCIVRVLFAMCIWRLVRSVSFHDYVQGQVQVVERCDLQRRCRRAQPFLV